MRSALLLFWALAPCLAIQNPRRHIQSLSPRDVAVETQTTQITEEHIVTSFSQVTETYTSIKTAFVETSQTLYSQNSFEQVTATLTKFQTVIEEAVTTISGGCNCDAAGVSTETIEATVTTWFSQLQYMVQTCQQRFPSRYSSFTSIFTQVSTHLQVALGVGFVSGLDVQPIVQRAFKRARVDQSVFSRVHIETTSFTHISTSIENRSGVFAHVPTPVGRRYPDRLQAALTSARKSGAAHNGTLPVGGKHGHKQPTDSFNATAPVGGKHGHKQPISPTDSFNGTAPVGGKPGQKNPIPPTDSLTHGTAPNSTVPANGHHVPGYPKPEPEPSPLTRNPNHTQEPNPPTPGSKQPTTPPVPGHKNPNTSPWSGTTPGSHNADGSNPTTLVTPWNAHKPAPGSDFGSNPGTGGFHNGLPEDRTSGGVTPPVAPWSAHKPVPGSDFGSHPGTGGFHNGLPGDRTSGGSYKIPEHPDFSNNGGSTRPDVGAPTSGFPSQISANHGPTGGMPSYPTVPTHTGFQNTGPSGGLGGNTGGFASQAPSTHGPNGATPSYPPIPGHTGFQNTETSPHPGGLGAPTGGFASASPSTHGANNGLPGSEPSSTGSTASPPQTGEPSSKPHKKDP
ncbi:hypothetical protein PtA15_9A147 [Puccinia triticina]|uniref:Brl1/Brr6 domain-containing protein n=1 Tax=Puccinia triticina TaxID=208348 RepID=A0ABY7CVK9_9BASI|nr:uncharacterized protein PtA15_9A147 [Puccinia triticina]WAQ88022.1 hypothetical protein PtA15_9A147 [Puccinia triticina]